MQITRLKRDGFIRVSYPTALQPVVHRSMLSWERFCELSIEDKKQLSLGDRLRDIGYVFREADGPNADSKEFFHASRGMPEEVRERADKISDPHAVEFLDATDDLIKAVEPLIQTFAQQVEFVWTLPGFEDEVMGNRDNWKFRYLHYFPNGVSGGPIAHAHADRGGFTLHLNESHPGAEYLSFEREWKPLVVDEKETVIFPSMGLQQRSRSVLKALCHQVLATPETAEQGRYSMVAFIDFLSPVRFDDNTYRLQDLAPGFNYTMPSHEFQKLFIPR